MPTNTPPSESPGSCDPSKHIDPGTGEPDTGEPADELLRCHAKDRTTHAVCVASADAAPMPSTRKKVRADPLHRGVTVTRTSRIQ